MLNKLKENGNKYYQFHEDYNAYKIRCREADPIGYDVVFAEEDNDSQGEIEIMGPNVHEVQDEIVEEEDADNTELKENIDYENNDPVKKYQFQYNRSLCMTNKYPETSVSCNETISVAPGEGKVPKDILSEEDWDLKAFPHLNNADGSNGKDCMRSTRLTDQNYFIQRICNKEERFARSPAYMYAAVGYLEKKQLQRNINIANTRGKEVVSETGEKSYVLEDGYRVLDNIKNTPRYWKQAKHEMLAKLDNLGPFHLFFTLSCGDMRWDENFGAVLQDKGWDVKYTMKQDEEHNWDTIVEARKSEDDNYKPIKQFIKEDLDETVHELVRNNVLTATRYFQHRVKQFISKVMMGKNNPMNVKYFTYKVEFQDRGAGHIHGTLWLNIEKIEKLELDNGERPFSQLTAAFRKFRKNENLNNKEKESIAAFIEQYTTVSIHEGTVGREVAKIAQEVNKHHHTKTCRKHDSTCRFNYPRYPSPHTIIVEPCQGMSPVEKDNLLAKYQMVLRRVKTILDDENAVDSILEKYQKQQESTQEYKSNIEQRIREMVNMAGVDYNEYLKALGTGRSGYSVVQQRDIDETFINSYNSEWIRAWNANLDIQVVLDYFAVITYVTDYYAKDDTGTMEVIKAALQQADAEDVKEKMKVVSNAFLTHRQMGEAEAVYKLLPSMTLKNSNVACQWVSLGRKEER